MSLCGKIVEHPRPDRETRYSRSIDACIQERQGLFQHSPGCFSDTSSTPIPKVDGLDLLDHNETGQGRCISDGNMKRESSVSIGHWTDKSHSRAFVELRLADDQCGAPALLLMAGLRVETHEYEVALFWYVCPHLPDLLAARIAPILLLGPVILWNSCEQVFQFAAPSDAFRGLDNNDAVSR